MKKTRIFTVVLSLVFLIIAVLALCQLVSFKQFMEAPNTDSSAELDIYALGLVVFAMGGILLAIIFAYKCAFALSLIFAAIASNSSLRGIRVASRVTLALLVLSFVAFVVLMLV